MLAKAEDGVKVTFAEGEDGPEFEQKMARSSQSPSEL
jgi:hypothetical protein